MINSARNAMQFWLICSSVAQDGNIGSKDLFIETPNAKLYNNHPDLDFIVRVIRDNEMDMNRGSTMKKTSDF